MQHTIVGLCSTALVSLQAVELENRSMSTGQKPSVSAAAEALFETKNVADIRKVGGSGMQTTFKTHRG